MNNSVNNISTLFKFTYAFYEMFRNAYITHWKFTQKLTFCLKSTGVS